jgi:hypothetical protein
VNEQTNQLESRLSQLRPRPLSASLERRIAGDLEHLPTGPKDRLFLSSVASGLIADCIIVCVLIHEPSGPAMISPIVQPNDKASLAIFARADGRWGDELKLASDWSIR